MNGDADAYARAVVRALLRCGALTLADRRASFTIYRNRERT